MKIYWNGTSKNIIGQMPNIEILAEYGVGDCGSPVPFLLYHHKILSLSEKFHFLCNEQQFISCI